MTATFRVDRGDWVVGAGGQVETVEGRDKLRQDVAQMLTISVQNNGFGSELPDLVNTVQTPQTLQFFVIEALRGAVERLQALQARQRAQRTAEERVRRISSLSVDAVNSDRASVTYSIGVQSEAGGDVAAQGVV